MKKPSRKPAKSTSPSHTYATLKDYDDPHRAFEARFLAEVRRKQAASKKHAETGRSPHAPRGTGRGQTIARTFTLYPTDYAKLRELSNGVPRMESAIIRDLIRKAKPYDELDVLRIRQADGMTRSVEQAYDLFVEAGDTGIESQGGSE